MIYSFCRESFRKEKMSKTFFQDASHAAAYALFRPAYSTEVANIILSKLSSHLPVEVRLGFKLALVAKLHYRCHAKLGLC